MYIFIFYLDLVHVSAIINAKQPAAYTALSHTTLPARDQVQTSSCVRLTSVPPATTAATASTHLITGGLCGEQMSTVSVVIADVGWE